MENTVIENLVGYILPAGITEYFTVNQIKQQASVLTICLDEKNVIPEEHQDRTLVSKGFYPSSRLEDFPIRGYKVYLQVRRRKWKDVKTNQLISRDWHLTAKGTSYTNEFGAFLKELVGYTSY